MEKQGEWTTRAVILLSLFFLILFLHRLYNTGEHLLFNFTENPPLPLMFYYLQVGKGKFYRLKLNINLICKQGLQNAFSVEFMYEVDFINYSII